MLYAVRGAIWVFRYTIQYYHNTQGLNRPAFRCNCHQNQFIREIGMKPLGSQRQWEECTYKFMRAVPFNTSEGALQHCDVVNTKQMYTSWNRWVLGLPWSRISRFHVITLGSTFLSENNIVVLAYWSNCYKRQHTIHTQHYNINNSSS